MESVDFETLTRRHGARLLLQFGSTVTGREHAASGLPPLSGPPPLPGHGEAIPGPLPGGESATVIDDDAVNCKLVLIAEDLARGPMAA